MENERKDIGYGVSFGGVVLDGCSAEYLTFDNINDISTILGYRYEDGKWWHDQTCVMEIIFYSYHENIDVNRVRVLYNSPSDLIFMLNRLVKNGTCCMRSIKIDLSGYCVDPADDEESVNKADFENFNCKNSSQETFLYNKSRNAK